MKSYDVPNPHTHPEDTTLWIPGHGIVDVHSKLENLGELTLEQRKEKDLQDDKIKLYKAILENQNINQPG